LGKKKPFTGKGKASYRNTQFTSGDGWGTYESVCNLSKRCFIFRDASRTFLHSLLTFVSLPVFSLSLTIFKD
jgi:hypothetical protein